MNRLDRALKRRIAIQGALVLVVMLLLIGSGCRKAAPPGGAAVPEVAVTSVIQRDVTVYSESIGTTEGFVNASIYPKISGYVVKQSYRDGDVVHAGQPLFQIDPRQYKAALDQALGTLAQSQAQLKQNQLNLTRDTDLYKQGVISRKEFDDQTQTTRGTAAQVQANEAAVESARLNLGWTQVTSPVTGVAAIATAQVGDLVSSNSLLTTVSQLDPIKVEFPISEQTYLHFAERINEDPDKRAKDSLKFQMILANGATYKYFGQLYAVNRQVDVQTGTIIAQATFPNPDNTLRPGLYAKIRAAADTVHNALLVPQNALLQTQGQYQVAVVDSGNKVTMRNVTIGDQEGSFQVIKNGVAAGERVVTDGLQKVHDGIEVNPHEAAAAPASDKTPAAGASAAAASSAQN